MEPWYKIDKKLKSGEYSTEDLFNYLSHDNDGVLYNTLSVIAENKIQDILLIEKITKIATGKDIALTKGLPGVTIKFVAIATLRELGTTEYFDLLNDEEKNIVLGAFS
ncbi:hypothetical protein [Enterococcus sp. LJL51]|uniref:hypothetical protein n=1 Tax=Enterococcus sp. LJL51 TaxID=3416656 RepID=UPI003CF993F8